MTRHFRILSLLLMMVLLGSLMPIYAQEATEEPLMVSTETPTTVPSNTPTTAPSNTPTTAPSNTPTTAPSNTPTTAPSNTPTTAPSNTPTTAPSNTPTTVAASETPTTAPSNTPTDVPASETPTTVPPSETPTTVAASETPAPSATSATDFDAAMENQLRVKPDVVDALRNEPNVRVIVNFTEPVGAQGAGDEQRKQMLSTQRNNIVDALNSPQDIAVMREYDHVSMMAAEITQEGAVALLNNPLVESVEIDEIVRISLSTARNQINVPSVESLGFDGSGVTVAVVDTGIQANHPALSDDVLAQQCFHTEGTCPGGGTQSDNAADGHGHGTHVAGIISSNDSTRKGVANGAGIVAVKVLTDAGYGYTSDIVAGLNWVYTNRNTYNIRVVNMSLGDSSSWNSACDSGSWYTSIVNQLTNAGVYVIAASGNNGYQSGIGSPACVSNIISVGSVTSSDSVSYFSNVGALLDVFAPGSSICSPIPTNTYACWSGTSMASPMVAGVVALMLDADPSLTFTQVRNKLQSTGPVISAYGYDVHRVDAAAAIGDVATPTPTLTPTDGPSPTPTLTLTPSTTPTPSMTPTITPTPVAPPGAVTMGDTTDTDTLFPTLNWTLDADAQRATEFSIYVGEYYSYYWDIQETTSRAEVCGSSTGTTCSFTMPEELEDKEWYIAIVIAENASGYNDYAVEYFYVEAAVPGRVYINSVSDTDTLLPTINFTLPGDADLATDFEVKLRTRDNRTWIVDTAYTRSALCGTSDGTTCSFTPPSDLTNGQRYVVMIRGLNDNGAGSWRARYFDVQIPVPGRVTMGTVDNTDTLLPTVNWSLDADAALATDFEVYLRPRGRRSWDTKSLYTREQLCGTADSTACSFTPASNLNNNTRYVFMIRGVSPYGEGRSTSRYFTVSAPVPGPVTMGTVDNTDTLLPTVNWSLDADAALATDFRVYMRPRSSRQWTVNATYTRTEVCGAVDSTICSFTPATDLINNTQYVFMIRGQGEYGTGSARASYFTVEAPAPAQVTMGNAVDTDTLQPTVNWTLDGDATLATDFKVLLRPRTSRRWTINTTYTREQLCGTADGTTCSFTPADNLSNNSQYVLMVRGIGEYGIGGSRARYFNVDAPTPERVTMGNAVDTDTLQPTVNWTLDGDATLATSFKVLLRPRTSRQWTINTTYTREQLCGTADGTTCSFTPADNLSNDTRYIFMVRGIGEYGVGGARARYFNIDIPAPGSVSMGSAVNTDTLQPSIHWLLEGDATSATDFVVYLRPTDSRTWSERATYTREALCGTSDGTSCSFTPTTSLSNNTDYIFMVRGKNAGGLGQVRAHRFTINS